MAFPVDTSVKHMLWDMTGAPTLNGAAGTLIDVLDAFLVNGWGSQTASSVVIADGVATVTTPSAFPATVDSVVLVAGATPSGLNGEQKVTVVGPGNTFKFATEESDGSATGTITVKMAPAGWEKAFSGTNKAAYRSLDPQAHGGGMYLRVDDSGTTLARVVGYESMSDVDTGTGPFPTSTQVSGGGYWAKSATANTTPRGYALFADSRTFLIALNPSGTTVTSHVLRGFGDGITKRPSGDAFAVFISAASDSALTSIGGALDGAASSFAWTPKTYTGFGSAEAGRTVPYVGSAANSSGNDNTVGTFPNPVDGSLLLSRRFWATGTTSPNRFDIPGLYHVPQTGVTNSFASYDKVPGSGDLPGRQLLFVPLHPSAASNQPTGGSFVDVTGPWR